MEFEELRLRNDIQDIRDQNELLEFRMLELEVKISTSFIINIYIYYCVSEGVWVREFLFGHVSENHFYYIAIKVRSSCCKV